MEKDLKEPAPVLNSVGPQKSGITYANITTVGMHGESKAQMSYMRFFADAISSTVGQFLEKPNGTSSKSDINLQNFAKQLIYNEKYIFTDYCELISQGTSADPNQPYNVAFKRLDGSVAKRGDSITFPKGATYEFDSNGDGTIDIAWVFADTFKVVYNPAPCANVAGCTNGCGTDLWHVYEETENYTYNIQAVSIHTGATNTGMVTFAFSDNAIVANSTVDLGYCTGAGNGVWTAPDDDAMTFLHYIKINGSPILSVYPTCTLQGLDQYNGLCLNGLSLKVGDVISIDKGAVFRHNGISMCMDYTFSLTVKTVSGTAITMEATKA